MAYFIYKMSNSKIDISSAEKFYESYEKYYMEKVKFNTQSKKLQYYLLCHEYNEIFFAEGYSMEEIYYIMLFKIGYECWSDIYGCEFEMEILVDPVKLFYSQYGDNPHYSFGEVNFTNSNLLEPLNFK